MYIHPYILSTNGWEGKEKGTTGALRYTMSGGGVTLSREGCVSVSGSGQVTGKIAATMYVQKYKG